MSFEIRCNTTAHQTSLFSAMILNGRGQTSIEESNFKRLEVQREIARYYLDDW